MYEHSKEKHGVPLIHNMYEHSKEKHGVHCTDKNNLKAISRTQ